MSTDTSSRPRRARSCLVPVGVCVGISAVLGGTLFMLVQKAQDAVRMSVVT